MPSVKTQGRECGRETRVAKVSKEAARRQLNRLPVAGRTTGGVPPKPLPSRLVSPDGEYTPVSGGSGLIAPKSSHPFVPVVDGSNGPLMPTTDSRARRWISSGKATPFWRKGVFCVRLNVEPSGRESQPVACGIDPGSKKEGFTIKSKAHTYLNVQADAVTWVKGDAPR